MRGLIRGLLPALLLLGAPAPVAAQTSVGPVFLSNTTCPGDGCVLMNTSDKGTAGVQLTVSGTATATFEVSNNGRAWSTVNATPPNSTTQVTIDDGDRAVGGQRRGLEAVPRSPHGLHLLRGRSGRTSGGGGRRIQ
jgi:hypothetical protein